VAAGTFLLELTTCRIYRQDAAARGRQEIAQESPARADGVPAEEPAADPPAPPPPAQALSLWVLNRSNTDLVAPDIDRSAEPASTSGGTPASALVVLGFGPPQVCAEHVARRALTLLADGRSPVETIAQLLDEIRRRRWPEDSSSFAVALRGANGSFGAVQSAPAQAFSPQLLLSAVSQHAVIDGRSSRWQKDIPAASLSASREESALTGCDDPSMKQLRGAVGVLLLEATGEIFAGVLERELPTDAGVMSLAAQYGVSLAVNKAGGVMLIGDCPTLPDEAIAARLLASLKEGAGEAPGPAVGACPQAHAILTPGDARVATTEPLAWGRATASQLTEKLQLHPRPQGGDAGAPILQGVTPP